MAGREGSISGQHPTGRVKLILAQEKTDISQLVVTGDNNQTEASSEVVLSAISKTVEVNKVTSSNKAKVVTSDTSWSARESSKGPGRRLTKEKSIYLVQSFVL
jgi:uncharacterized protein YsxB (DUF464 family)